MNYIWTEDTGAGLHYWQMVNHYLFHDEYVVESKQSNQGLLDATRKIDISDGNYYYLAFDIVYDNMDILNKYLDLREIAGSSDGRIVLVDIICFEYVILAFQYLVEWTQSGRKDKIFMREHILQAMQGHRINLDMILDGKTRNYLMGFKNFSTERVVKSLLYELTDRKRWSVKGSQMGECWYKDCCILEQEEMCNINGMSRREKMETLLHDAETLRLVSAMWPAGDTAP